MEVLKVKNLSRNFGGVRALQNVTFVVEAGQRLAIIGPNGAGKTTLLNVLNGQLSANSGYIYFMGRNITNLAVHKRAHLGLARAFQASTLFHTMSVLNNLLLAIHGVKPSRYQIVRPFHAYSDYVDEAENLLKTVDLWQKKYEIVKDLSHGEQKKLEIAMSLASKPKFLLLDEPSAGLTTGESSDMVKIIRSLGPNITILVVAHDMDLVFGMADDVMVLHYGQIICRGTPEEVQCNQKVIEIYMGSEEPIDDVGVN